MLCWPFGNHKSINFFCTRLLINILNLYFWCDNFENDHFRVTILVQMSLTPKWQKVQFQRCFWFVAQLLQFSKAKI